MSDITQIAEEALNKIKETDEYKDYQRLLAQLKEQPEVYNRLMELRDKNFDIQMSSGGEALDRMDALTYEYQDVINMELAAEFLAVEAAFCRMMQKFNDKVFGGLEFD
mgnify:CR=1 FL=1